MNSTKSMKIIITKHAIQRREHREPIDKAILVNLVKQLEKQFLLSTRENNKYKISHRNTVAIIQKTDVALILITAYCFEKYDYNIENIPLKISIAIDKANRFKHNGILHKIFRINFLNNKIQCGIIADVTQSENIKDIQQKGNFKYKIVIDSRLFRKFKDIPMENSYLYFNDFKELSNIVHLENEEFMLNIFQRNP